MGKIKGVDIRLFSIKETSTDPFGAPITEEIPVTVSNVLISPVDTQDLANELSLTGKHVEYRLAIPKGDNNEWTDRVVEFYGKRWKTVGTPLESIEAMTPLSWNKKVLVERYEI